MSWLKGSKRLRHADMTPDAREALKQAGYSRRDFLSTAGVLIVGFRMASGSGGNLNAQTTSGAAIPVDQVDSWLAVAADGTITGYAGKCDFGQGFRTVQMQLVAEELSAPFSAVKMVICDTELTPDQGVSSGSQGSPTQFGPSGLRQALATAREALFQMAAERFGVPVSQLSVKDGVISNTAKPDQQVTYAQLIAGKKLAIGINPNAVPKPYGQYTVLGKSIPRVDIPPKATGQFQYVHHVRVPGMLHGRMVRPPMVGAAVVSVDQSSIQNMPGRPKVVVKGNFIGVVADTQYDALQAAQALNVTWAPGPALPKQSELYSYMRQQRSRDSYTVLAPDVDQKLSAAARTVSATYLHPYQMHGSMGTSCAVADVKGTGDSGSATFWAATQELYPMRDSMALVLGIPAANIHGIFVEGSGCYGLNGVDSVAYDAAILSQSVGAPVRVQYTRYDEAVAGESYGPAYVIDLRAGLDSSGQIMAWDYEAWTLSRGNRPNATTPGNIYTGALLGFPTPALTPAKATPPASYRNNSNAASSYGSGCVNGACAGTGNVESERILLHTIESPFFTGPLRSPNRLQNTFANESFMDELAHAAHADPVEFRLRHLTDQRLMDCIRAAANAYGWDTRPSPTPALSKRDRRSHGIATGRGIACVLYEGGNGYCALIAEVQVQERTGAITVTRLVASQDSGPISNPNGLQNQMEGGAMQGMSRALYEELTWDDQGVLSTDWSRYPAFHFGDFLPQIQTVPINRTDQHQTGAGECVITCSAAAIGNAVFDATGVRLRQVPFTPENYLKSVVRRRTF